MTPYLRRYPSGRVSWVRPWVNSLVCVCDPSPARAEVDWGQCPVCKRKPLALFRVTA